MLPDAASGQGPGIPPEAGPESCPAVPRGAQRMRGYKVDRKQVTSQGTKNFIACTGPVAGHVITNLSMNQELIAKSVTNK